MDRQRFLKSEAARILVANIPTGGADSPHLPGWITDEHKALFRSLTPEEIAAIRAQERRSTPYRLI